MIESDKEIDKETGAIWCTHAEICWHFGLHHCLAQLDLTSSLNAAYGASCLSLALSKLLKDQRHLQQFGPIPLKPQSRLTVSYVKPGQTGSNRVLWPATSPLDSTARLTVGEQLLRAAALGEWHRHRS